MFICVLLKSDKNMPEFFYALLLAHILADYVFQPDALVRWKVRHIYGLLAHGGVVFLLTLVLSLPYSSTWWPYALLVAVLHTIVDFPRAHMGGGRPGILSFWLLLLDQCIHLFIIAFALFISGYLFPDQMLDFLADIVRNPKLLGFAIGYSLDTIPSWVLIRFLVRGLIPKEELTFGNRYVVILERLLITTFVLLGKFWFIPLVLLPRLIFEGLAVRAIENEENHTSYLIELLTSVLIAVVIGLALRAGNGG